MRWQRSSACSASPRRPRTLQQHHVASAVQGEAKPPGAVGGHQQIATTGLKGIDQTLTLGHGNSSGEQRPGAESLHQQACTGQKGRKHHHRLALLQQRAHQGLRRRQLVVGTDLTQGREHRQHLGVAMHLTPGRAAAVREHRALKAMLKAPGLAGIKRNGMEQTPLGGQIEAVLLAAVQHQRTNQALQLAQVAGTVGLPDAGAAAITPVALAEQLLVAVLVLGQGMANGGQQRE
jgi:hypothetical protein